MSDTYDIVIVGAGLVGSTLALWLAEHTDYRIAIVEKSAPLEAPTERNQRVVALGRVATDILQQVNVFAELGLTHAYPYQRMVVWDENSNGELEFNASDTEQSQLGYMVDAIKCTELLQAQLFRAKRIEPFFNCSVSAVTIDPHAAVLVTEQGRFQANLLVAADGGRSLVRQQAKIFANHHPYQQRGIVARIRTQSSHQDCAWQRFLQSGPIAVLPLNENESSIVWSAETLKSNALMALDDTAFCEALADALDGRLGEVALLSERQAFTLQSMRAETYYRRNLVLIGDAAHAIHPLAGQGANLGFKDIVCLGSLLQSVSAKELGNPRLLKRFEQARKPDNEQTDTFMTALYSAYRNRSPVVMSARGLGMNMLSRSAVMRQFLASQAIGS